MSTLPPFARRHIGPSPDDQQTMLDEVGVDNVLFETDYPHSDGTFPRSKEVAHSLFGHLEPEVVHKLARGNAIKLFNLDL